MSNFLITMIHDDIKKLFCCLNLFDYPFNSLQPRFGVRRTIRQYGASAMRPGEVHDDGVSRDEDGGDGRRFRISSGLFRD